MSVSSLPYAGEVCDDATIIKLINKARSDHTDDLRYLFQLESLHD